MPSTVLAPAIPGLTVENPWDRKQPDLFRILAMPSGTEEQERRKAGALVEYVKCQFEAHQWYYREAALCTAFYYGAHWGYWNELDNSFVGSPEPREADMVRVVINLYKPTCDQGASILTQEAPIFGTVAGTSEYKDSAASEVSDLFSRYLWREYDFDGMYELAARDSFSCGTAFWLCEWDPLAGPSQVVMEMDPLSGQMIPKFRLVKEPEYGEDGSLSSDPQIEPIEKPTGDYRFTYLAREQVAFDSTAKNWRTATSVAIRMKTSQTDLYERYKEKFDGDAAGVRSDDSEFSTESASKASLEGAPWTSEAAKKDEREVYRLYVKKCGKYRRGKFFEFDERRIYLDKDNPVYPPKEAPDEAWPRVMCPLFTFICDDRGTSPWGLGRGKDILNPQKDFNATVSKAIQHIAVAATAKFVMPQAVKSSWDTEVGQVFRTPRGMPAGSIHAVHVQDLSPVYVSMAEFLETKMEKIAGINAATQGESPSSGASGRMVNSLQARDFARLRQVKQRLDNTMAEMVRYCLYLWRENADARRKIVVAGENQEIQVLWFDKSTLAAGTDVVVLNDSSIPRDPAQRMIVLRQFFETLNMIQDPGLKNALFDVTRFRDFAGYAERVNADQVKARRNALQILAGKPVFSYEGDDPMIHKAELDRLAKSREFERLVLSQIESDGWSQAFEYLTQLNTYYTMLSAGKTQVRPGGEVPPPTAPAPKTFPTPPQPGVPMPQPQQGPAPVPMPGGPPSMPSPAGPPPSGPQPGPAIPAMASV